MKKVLALLLCGLLVVSLLLCGGCSRQPGENSSAAVSANDSVSGQLRVSLTVVKEFTASKVEEVEGIFKDLICVYGEHKGQHGFFYVNTDGQVLGDYVFNYATEDFYYLNGSGYYTDVQLADHSWHTLSETGELSAEINDPTRPFSCERYMEEVDGEERWGIRDRSGEIVLEPTYSWILAIDDPYYNYAITADGQPVLIDWDGVVQVTLPQRCTGVFRGPAGFVGTFQYGDYSPTYSLLDFTGRQLASGSYECLTPVQQFLAAGVLDGKLVLVDEFGTLCLYTDIATMREHKALAFDGEKVAAVLEDNTLGIYQVTYDEEPPQRIALDLVKRAEWIENLYNQGGNAGGKGVEGEDYLKEGTTLEYMGQTVALESNYERFVDYFPEFQVTNWAELESIVESVYTRDTAVEAFYTTPSKHASHFIQHNGQVFGVLAEGAYGGQWDESSLTILSQTADTVCFSIRNYTQCPTEDSLSTHYFCMKKTDAGWRLESDYFGSYNKEEMLREMAYRAFLRDYAAKNGVDSATYGYMNIDGSERDELLITTNDGRLLVYTYADGQLKEVDSWKYGTATTKFLRSGDGKYPGLVVFSSDNGRGKLSYLSIADGAIVLQELLTQTTDGKSLSEKTEDKTLLDLAKKTYAEDNILNFRPLPGRY